MKKIILDTNFILTCSKQKIDFFEYLESEGFEILIPKQVISEIKRFADSNKKLKFKNDAVLSMKILNSNKYSEIDLGENYVDRGIVRYAKKNPEVVVATLDREIKKKVRNKKLVIKGKKELNVI